MRGPSFKGREGKGTEGKGRGRKGRKGGRKGRENGREGKERKGEGCVMAFGGMDAPEEAALSTICE